MDNLWNIILFQPLLNSLVLIYKLTENLGWSIILLTIGLRVLMTPIIIPGLKISKKMQDLAPELNKLKLKHKNDKTGLVAAQTELYKNNGVNPASGCLPQIIQLLVLIALYSVLNTILKAENVSDSQKLNPQLYSTNRLSDSYHISPDFLYLNLTQPDVFKLPMVPFPLPGMFLLLSALTQFISSKMMSPIVNAEKKVAEKTESSSDDTMVEVQQQMLIMFPLMTLVIGFQFPSGLVIYWFVFSLLSIIQQYLISGWGGMTPWLRKLNLLKS